MGAGVSRLNRTRRVFNTRTTYRTIIHPDVNTHHPMFPGVRAQDYISVPRLATQGTWPVSYMLSDEQLLHLAVLANHLQPKRETYADRFEQKRQARVAESKVGKSRG